VNSSQPQQQFAVLSTVPFLQDENAVDALRWSSAAEKKWG